VTWANFYLVCFAVGFAFSVISFLGGGTRWRFHLPHLPHGAASVASGPVRAATDLSISPFNFVTFTAFLAWFGGTGYLLTRYSSVWFVMGLGIALISGLAGGGIVFLFLSKVLTSEEENMDPADYEMVGVIGRVSSSIRETGTGEIIYSQAGSRRACPARSEDSVAIERDAEVVVTRYEKGIAYIRRWEEVNGE
jgi:hypothetical protein